MSQVDQLAGSIRAAQRVAVLTGAGISTDSGIPDFRGPNGIWTRNPDAARQATIQHYLADPEVRRRAWRSRREHPAWQADPNPGHYALVELERLGKLLAVITQNVDGLQQRAGSSPDLVIEVHGTVWAVECLTCGRRTPMEEQLTRVDSGDDDPRCEACGGIQKSATISFGQALVPAVINRAWDAAASSDLFLAVGTSLTVYPVAGLCDVALEAGARLVIINAQDTPYDAIAHLVVREPISDVLPQAVKEAGLAL